MSGRAAAARDVRVLAYLRKCKAEGALWTGDIAHGIGALTTLARASLTRLEAAGRVERVVVGNPTSWRIREGS